MSKPSGQRENAASVAPVSPAHSAKLPSGPAPPSAPQAAPPDREEVSIPPPQAAAASSDPRALPPLPSGTGHAEQNKWSKGPGSPQRPSLLTQALAAARAISSGEAGLSQGPTQEQQQQQQQQRQQQRQRQQSHQQSQQLHSYQDSFHPTSTGLQTQRVPPTLNLQYAADAPDGSPYQSDGDSLTPRGSPRTATMASTVDYPPPHAPRYSTVELCQSPTQDMLDFDEASSAFRGRGDFDSRSNGWAIPTDVDDRNNAATPGCLHRAQTVATAPIEPPGITPVPLADPTPVRGISAPDEKNSVAESSTHGLPRKLEHRLSLGPEKAWSIGAGELSNNPDGQVEKSITEVLAGVEPNARSRKASHHLRFFKEGLPEEKGKRKDQRPRAQSHEKLSPTTEESLDADHQTTADEVAASDIQPLLFSPGVQPVSCTTLSPSVRPKADFLIDHAQSVPADRQQEESLDLALHIPPPDSNFRSREAGRPDIPSEAIGNWQPDGERKFRDRPKATETVEDGEDSGEEKISSAVFLPHQRLEDGSEASNFSHPPRAAQSSRSMARGGDFHPWLVKADEPEADEQEVRHGDYESDAKLRREETSTRVGVPSNRRMTDVESLPEESSDITEKQYESHVHAHQLAPKGPLEAIELIPYKHQVGGHTTLWRFSKRAVCKKLNNRENEFYERVEKYHRDLLAFLPRYIGVLNVTFQKRSRRKSNAKRENNPTREERRQLEQSGPGVAVKTDEDSGQGEEAFLVDMPKMQDGHHRVISQSLQSTQMPVPTVTFVDNQHILPRNLLQPPQLGVIFPRGAKSALVSLRDIQPSEPPQPIPYAGRSSSLRPALQERPPNSPNSWGATTINKRLRNEVFNDAFLKQPIAIQRHRKGHHRSLPRRALPHSGTSKSKPLDVSDIGGEAEDDPSQWPTRDAPQGVDPTGTNNHAPRPNPGRYERRGGEGEVEGDLKDVTGTSAPEPEIPIESPPIHRSKRRYSGSALRRKPRDVRESRGNLVYFEEADEAGYKGDSQRRAVPDSRRELTIDVDFPSEKIGLSRPQSPSCAFGSPSEFKIARPINPKEAQTQRDSRVEYFLLLEDLTAGMKRPCIMDLKMGTRQYGVDANPSKQGSQRGKCAKTTSRRLGVRVCGLQVWDAKSQTYVFKDKYFGRDLKPGREFQDALTRFLYDGVDLSSILRHVPTVLQKIDELEVIISRLSGYRFYAASLLMFYDSGAPGDTYDTAADDSTTDFATDTEEPPWRRRKDKREIDFKMADFANCITAGDITQGKSCPPRHPSTPDHGFLRGLRSLRKYFLKIQRDTRAELGLGNRLRNGLPDEIDLDASDDDGMVSE